MTAIRRPTTFNTMIVDCISGQDSRVIASNSCSRRIFVYVVKQYALAVGGRLRQIEKGLWFLER